MLRINKMVPFSNNYIYIDHSFPLYRGFPGASLEILDSSYIQDYMNWFSDSFSISNSNWTPFQSQGTNTTVARLLEGQKQNGLVDIAILEDPNAMFKMHERINSRNKASQYHDALNGTLEWNVLAQVFFSAENMQIIQNAIRANVHRMSQQKINVPNQNVDALKIIMRGIYLEYAEHYPTNIKEQVERLNQLVLDYAVPNVYSEAVSYFRYLVDSSTMAMPLEIPKASDRVYKQLGFRPFVEWTPLPQSSNFDSREYQNAFGKL